MPKTTRTIAAIVMALSFVALAAGPAAAATNVPFSVHKGPPGDADSWHAEVAGNVRFFSAERKFRVSGIGVYHHSPTDDGVGYLQARQNVARRASDPAWATVTEGACDTDLSVPLVTYTCEVNRLFQNATQPGHGLAGVWIRVCIRRVGPDECGAKQYRDNPLQG